MTGMEMIADLAPTATLTRLGMVREGRRVALLVSWQEAGQEATTRILALVPDDGEWRQKLVDTIVQTWPDRALGALEDEGVELRGLGEVHRLLNGIVEGRLTDLTAIQQAATRVLDQLT